MKNIIVLSHRRSGTHLTIDSITNNFEAYGKHKYLNIDLTKDLYEKKITVEKFKQKLKKSPRVIKSHHLPDFVQYYTCQSERKSVENFFADSHIVYVYRNGLDVMVSLYEYMRGYDAEVQKMNFADFLQTKNNFDPQAKDLNRIQSWKHHIEQWQNSSLADKILFISYEEIIGNYNEAIKKISKNISTPHKNEITDIRLKQSSSKLKKISGLIKRAKGIKKTSVSARKGRVGDHSGYFSQELKDDFLETNGELMKKLGYI